MEILKLSRMTIYRYLKSGFIKSAKIKGQHRIPESEITKLLKDILEDKTNE
jgi:excisionase family DNA binding protein